MSALVKKEIRLLLPGWLAVLGLVVVLPGLFWEAPDDAFPVMSVAVFLGFMILSVDSFGREFSLGTFASLMAQPMERRRIWQIKLKTLFLAAGLIFTAYFVSLEILYHHALKVPVWGANPKTIAADFKNALAAGVAGAFVAMAGGLWTALLLRQTAAAFWITFLTPLGALTLIAFFLPGKLADNNDFLVPLFYTLAGLYTVFGFWLAHRLFHRVQDAGWTGGVISFSTWRYFEARSSNAVSRRQWRPWVALFKKEFQLHSIGLFCAGALLALHIITFFLRAFHTNTGNDSLVHLLAEFFWIFWLIMPLVIGCMAVAEERKLGVTAEQFCLSISRRRQFIVKFVPVLIAGVLLGGVMPLILETVAAYCGVPNAYFKFDSGTDTLFSSPAWIFMMALSLVLTLIGFYASTLARNFLQALTIAIIAFIVSCFAWSFLFGGQVLGEGRFVLGGVTLWGALPPLVIGTLVAIFLLPWLFFQNFSHFAESNRLWRRNLSSIALFLLFVFGSSAAIYHRVWETFEPAEPPHGVARLSLSHPPVIQGDFGNTLVRLPDGRVWYDCQSIYEFSYDQGNHVLKPWRVLWRAALRPLPASLGPRQFLDGSNWLSASAVCIGSENPYMQVGYLNTIGIKTDGTLWFSDTSTPATWAETKMVQYGSETDWAQFNRTLDAVLLLKKDGTLWLWKTSAFGSRIDFATRWPTLQNAQPERVGTDSDWKHLLKKFGYAQKADGSIWWLHIDDQTGKISFKPQSGLDRLAAQNPGYEVGNGKIYLAPNGTLKLYLIEGRPAQPVGRETDWVGLAGAWDWMVTLKSDGSLWQWNLSPDPDNGNWIENLSPTRLGIHHDWVAVNSRWGGIVALAADGSLWFWPSPRDYEGPVWRAPKQPQFLGNIFSESQTAER